MEETITQDNGASVADVVEDNNTSVSVENTEMDASMSVTLDATPEPAAETPVALEMPEKFANAEDPTQALLKSYMELQKGQSQAEPEATPEATPEVEPEATPEAETTAERSVVEKAQDDWAKQGGQLSDEQWDNIQKETGIPMDTLKAWETHVKDSMVANSQTNDQKIYEAAGGQAEYDKMIAWASTNLTDEQNASLDAQLDNPQFSEGGINMLKGMYKNAVGFEASIDPVASVDPTSLAAGEFLNEADFHEAMNHADYGKGGRYDKEFDARAMRYMKRTGQAS